MADFDRLSSAWRLHFRCVFDLRLVSGSEQGWPTLLKTIRAWIREKENAQEVTDAIGRRWFFDGGRHSGHVGNRWIVVQTHRFDSSGGEAPDFWALRYEHSADDPSTFLTWRTDLAVVALDRGQYRLAMQVSNALHPGFVGEEPEPPTPSAPRIITKLLTTQHWHATAGSAVLRALPEVLAVGQGAQLISRLADPERRCPLLLLSCDRGTGSPKLDASRIARLLAGTAQVVVAPAGDVAEELGFVLPDVLRCTNGTARLYLQGVRIETPESDYRRHRFVRGIDIDAANPAPIEGYFVSAVARRLPVGFPDVVWCIEDVERRAREVRFAALREQLATSPDRELLELLEQDNVALQKDLNDLKGLVERRDDEVQELSTQLGRMTFQRDRERARAEAAETQAQALRAGRLTLESLAGCPHDVEGVIDWVTALWGDRVVFTDRARKSAARASINKDRAELDVVWRILRSIAVDLHPLLGKETPSGGTIADEYRTRSGFELSWTEGKQTKKDNKLMQLRQLEYKGATLDITPHIKYGNKSPKCLRVHFAVDESTGVVIVGHCGDHLDTYGTQKLT